MDAKAKVVGWLVTDHMDRPWDVVLHEVAADSCASAIKGHSTPLIPLTDHEAALAELVEENATSEAIWARKCDELDLRLQTLLTGLEALAGEWKLRANRPVNSFEDSVSQGMDMCADQLITLTNSAKAST